MWLAAEILTGASQTSDRRIAVAETPLFHDIVFDHEVDVIIFVFPSQILAIA